MNTGFKVVAPSVVSTKTTPLQAGQVLLSPNYCCQTNAGFMQTCRCLNALHLVGYLICSSVFSYSLSNHYEQAKIVDHNYSFRHPWTRGSACKPLYRYSDLVAVTHQNGFTSGINWPTNLDSVFLS
jgi:hypothetical protein